MIECIFCTNKGLKRSSNQDSVLIDKFCLTGSMDLPIGMTVDKFPLIFAVADGMGGHAGGEKASYMVVDNLKDLDFLNLANNSEEEINEILHNHFIASQGCMDALVEKFPNLKGMGTAVAGVIIYSSKCIIFNSGDCRVYQFNNGYLRKLSHDHSLVQQLYDLGQINEDDMRTHPKSNVLTSAVIAGEPKESIKIYSKTFPLRKEMFFLICSDGIWDFMSADDLESCYSNDIVKTGHCLFNKVMKTECGDNFSFILIKVCDSV